MKDIFKDAKFGNRFACVENGREDDCVFLEKMDFGDNCPLIPAELQTICSPGRPIKYKNITEDQIKSFVSWLESNYSIGIHGDPCNWKEFKLPKLDIYDDGIE